MGIGMSHDAFRGDSDANELYLNKHYGIKGYSELEDMNDADGRLYLAKWWV